MRASTRAIPADISPSGGAGSACTRAGIALARASTRAVNHVLHTPYLLGNLDQEVADDIHTMHKAGSCVSISIVILAAKGIVTHKKLSLQREHGGHIMLTKKDWADSFWKGIVP